MGNISKINVNGTEYNVTQSGAVSDVSLSYNGTKFGTISINEKGNVAVESLSKHVNIEAVKGIQMKPTTNIIIDTTRRLNAGNGNEAHIEVVYDDKGEEGAIEDTSYGELKIHARNFDLRCHDHGGIALQPCLCDHPNTETTHFENKIKFESSRRKDINTNVGELYDVSVADYDDEGGEGLEFGTFNNMHTSLYTKDYRFKRDGYVYAVDRGDASIESGKTKFDYPTQPDDTKDIKVNKTRIIGDSSIDVSLKATWEEIVWTARQYIDGCIGGGGTGGGDATKQWVTDNFATKNDISAFITSVPTPLEHITVTDKGNMQISAKDISTGGEYGNLNLESNAKIKIEAADDIEEHSIGNIIVSGSKIKLFNSTVNEEGEFVEDSSNAAIVESTNGITMGETPIVLFPTIKLSAKAALTNIDGSLGISYYNNFDGSTYYDSSNNVMHVPVEYTIFYTDNVAGNLYVPKTDSKATTVYYADGTQPNVGEIHFVNDNDSSTFVVEIIKSDAGDIQAKKKPKKYEETNVILEASTYTPDPSYIVLAPEAETVVDSVKVSDIVELVKHKDALLELLQQHS